MRTHRAVTRPLPLLALLALAMAACADPAATPKAIDASTTETASTCKSVALSTCLTPTRPPEYYVDQAQRYFDALDRSAPAERVPTYSELVARWEWPPWLKLTGYTKKQMEGTDKLVKSQAPAVVAPRDCRFFAAQPFARCRVSFAYDQMGGGKGCPIYEEFTFNDAGEITFIEAWSDLAAYLPMAATDTWAESPGVHRLSTRIPGLGHADGKLDLNSTAMAQAAAADAEVADFVSRANNFWPAWLQARKAGGDYFAVGCGW